MIMDTKIIVLTNHDIRLMVHGRKTTFHDVNNALFITNNNSSLKAKVTMENQGRSRSLILLMLNCTTCNLRCHILLALFVQFLTKTIDFVQRDN